MKKKIIFGVAIQLFILLSLIGIYFGETERQNICYYLICREENVTPVGAFDCCLNGGAGYVLKIDNKNTIVYAAYTSYETAKTVANRLQESEEGIKIMKAECDRIYRGKKRSLTLKRECERILYECANQMDAGEMSEIQGKSMVEDVFSILKAEASPLREESKLLLSGDVRYLQISLIEEIIKSGVFRFLEIL